MCYLTAEQTVASYLSCCFAFLPPRISFFGCGLHGISLDVVFMVLAAEQCLGLSQGSVQSRPPSLALREALVARISDQCICINEI